MKTLYQRLTVFFVGVPLIVSSVYFLPHYNFLVFHLEIVVSCIIAVFEIRGMMSEKLPVTSAAVGIFFGLLLLLTSYGIGLKLLPKYSFFYVLPIAFSGIMVREFILSFNGKFDNCIARIISGCFMIIYPWLFMIYLSAMTMLNNPHNVILIFLITVFFCDSFSWLFGVLLGKNNRGFIKASPKKSVAGFAGGFVGGITAALISFYFSSEAFSPSFQKIILLAFFTCAAAILGDLVESMFKRSSCIKDSGRVILGRGGILDSMDSILFAAPVFYTGYKFLLEGSI